jgi:hypothetical protein
MFYSLAGDFATELTKQVLASQISSILQPGTDGPLTTAFSALTTALGLNTTAVQTQTTTDQTKDVVDQAGTGLVGAVTESTGPSIVAPAVAGAASAPTVVELGEETLAINEQNAESASVAQQGLFGGLFDRLGKSFTGGFNGLESQAGAQQGLLGSVVGLLGAMLGGIWALVGPTLTIAAMAIKNAAIQAAILAYNAIQAVFAAIPFYAKGGMVKGYADGGKVQGFAQGGSASSLRTFQKAHNIPKSDTVPAMLTPGEFVLVPNAVKKYGAGFLSALNNGLIDPGAILGMPSAAVMTGQGAGISAFADGGIVAGNAASKAMGATSDVQQIVTPVMVADNSTMKQLTSGGRDTFDKDVNRTNLTGDKNRSKEWK